MLSEFGKALKIQIFGESHGEAIGCVISGLPAGEAIDLEELQAFMNRRAPGGKLATKRKEPDIPKLLSGIKDGKTTGAPLCAIIENTDTRSGVYAFGDTPRPSHADYTAKMRYGDSVDMRGSGHFSGRLTAPLCIAGGICKQLLARKGIFIGAHLQSVGRFMDEDFPLYPSKELFDGIAAKAIPAISDDSAELFADEIEAARMALDSVGGCIETAILGVPAGIGSPMFEGVENRLAQAIFGIPAVKGLEFGMGFASARLKGSQNNDPYCIVDGEVRTQTNNSGGIIGGITNGMPITFRAAMKPTPSIGIKQETVRLSTMEEAAVEIKGRHDPCVALRAVPVFEAVAAAVILDMYLEAKTYGLK